MKLLDKWKIMFSAFLFVLFVSFTFFFETSKKKKKQMQLDEVTEAWGIKVERVEM